MTRLAPGLLIVCAATAVAGIDIPSLGQPTPFYGAAGKTVKVEVSADPTDLTLDDTILFTLRITNLDNAPDVRKPDLGELESFRDFQVEDEPLSEIEPPGTRIFRYRLRPRRATVAVIPGILFPYYDPSLPQPADRPDLPFRKARTEPVPIRVRKAAPAPAAVVPLDVPAFAATPATASAWIMPGWVWWLAAMVPPVLAIGGCVVWQILNPVGTRLARRRRSRAARTAIRTLHSLQRHPPADPAAVVGALVVYLAERHDLPGLFRTPVELARRLRESGADDETIAECESFLREADAARFAPYPDVTGDALIDNAERLIRRQEGEA